MDLLQRPLQWNNKGGLVCERRFKNGATPRPQDLVISSTPGTTIGMDAGLPTQEKRSGGDSGSLSTTTLCATALYEPMKVQ